MERCFTPEEKRLIDVLVSQHDPSTEDWTEIVHPLTPEQKQRQRAWSARLSMVERFAVMTELNRRVLALRGITEETSKGQMNVSIVRHDGTLVRQIYPKPS